MKKIYLTIATTLIAASMLAQSPVLRSGQFNSEVKATPNNKVVTKSISDLKSFSSRKSDASRTTVINENISPVDIVAGFYGSTPYYALTNPMYPDSNATVAWTSGPGTPWLFGVSQSFHIDGDYSTFSGGVFDPALQPFSRTTDVRLDSIIIHHLYTRVNTSVVDTAFVYVTARGNGSQYNLGYYVSNPDSTKLLLNYTNKAMNNNAPDSVLAVYTVILDNTYANDTTGIGTHLIELAPNLTISNSRGLLGISLGFKPGKVHSKATDTIFSNTNYMSAVYVTPGGQSTAFPMGQGNDYNIGSFNDRNSKHGTWPYYLPPYVFTTDHPYQMYDMTIKIHQTNSDNPGVSELDKGATLFQNYPNPTNGMTTVKYELANNADVTFEMIDVTGKKVISLDQGSRNSGTHSIEINTAELNAGIYFYSVIVNGNIVTKKMTITK